MNFENYSTFYICLVFLTNLIFLFNLKWISKKINVYDKPDNLRKYILFQHRY